MSSFFTPNQLEGLHSRFIALLSDENKNHCVQWLCLPGANGALVQEITIPPLSNALIGSQDGPISTLTTSFRALQATVERFSSKHHPGKDVAKDGLSFRGVADKDLYDKISTFNERLRDLLTHLEGSRKGKPKRIMDWADIPKALKIAGVIERQVEEITPNDDIERGIAAIKSSIGRIAGEEAILDPNYSPDLSQARTSSPKPQADFEVPPGYNLDIQSMKSAEQEIANLILGLKESDDLHAIEERYLEHVKKRLKELSKKILEEQPAGRLTGQLILNAEKTLLEILGAMKYVSTSSPRLAEIKNSIQSSTQSSIESLRRVFDTFDIIVEGTIEETGYHSALQILKEKELTNIKQYQRIGNDLEQIKIHESFALAENAESIIKIIGALDAAVESEQKDEKKGLLNQALIRLQESIRTISKTFKPKDNEPIARSGPAELDLPPVPTKEILTEDSLKKIQLHIGDLKTYDKQYIRSHKSSDFEYVAEQLDLLYATSWSDERQVRKAELSLIKSLGAMKALAQSTKDGLEEPIKTATDLVKSLQESFSFAKEDISVSLDAYGRSQSVINALKEDARPRWYHVWYFTPKAHPLYAHLSKTAKALGEEMTEHMANKDKRNGIIELLGGIEVAKRVEENETRKDSLSGAKENLNILIEDISKR